MQSASIFVPPSFNSRGRDDAAWLAPCEGASAANAWSGWTEQRCQGQKGACSVHLILKRFGYIRLDYLYKENRALRKRIHLLELAINQMQDAMYVLGTGTEYSRRPHWRTSSNSC